MPHEIVTIIGSSYFEPISALIEKLQKYDKGREDGFQAGYYVNGYSASICILAVICLESYVMRVRYINKAQGKDLDIVPVPTYIANLYPDFPYKAEATEIFVVRDILAHNHLWEVSLSSHEDLGVQEIDAVRRSSGDKKYASCLEHKTQKTKTLKLNANPIKVGVSDSKKVLQAVWKILLFLESKDRNQCYVSHLHVMHKKKMVRFGEVIGMPETCT
ncbi:MAG: hypothetical protein DID89_2727546011 [Candidatus Nitrotoga sp. CP45]|nr:MAG: hypothetical protein DID89_2727546011 [Candidatus Nitrotoga sp. CP45]